MHRQPLFWTLKEIARLESRADVRGPRLTEPGQERWNRVRRALGARDFIRLLHEDLALPFPVPFDLDAWNTNPVDALEPTAAGELLAASVKPDDLAPHRFLRSACQALGLPAGGSIAEHPKVQAHQHALELPGTGGRVGLQQAIEYGVALDRSFVFVADCDEERAAVGIAIVEARANPPRVVTSAALGRLLAAGERFDVVFGVRGHPGAEHLAERHGLEVRWS